MHALSAVALGLLLLGAVRAEGVTLSGGGPRSTDCLLELMANGTGSGPSTVTCADGDACDADGERNGACTFTPIVCVNAADPALPACSPARVSKVRFKGKLGRNPLDTSGLAAAAAALPLPADGPACGAPVDLIVPIGSRRGRPAPGSATIDTRATTTKGPDKDHFRFVCTPGAAPATTTTTVAGATTTSSTSVVTTTTITIVPTTSTTQPLGTPGAGLDVAIVGVAVSADGHVTVTFHLTDDDGTPITPVTAATADPNQARVRFTIARLELDDETEEGFTTTFPRYVNYITRHVTGSGRASDQPTYDTTGAFALVDAAGGTWTYTFGTTLSGVQTGLTHTVGGQVQRTFAGLGLVANPIFNFVPDGSPVTTKLEDVTTTECNSCHNPLSAHGGGRRDTKLCVLCHTDQAIDVTTGNTIDFKQMVHRIHRGKDLPSVTGGAVGANYSIGNNAFGEKVMTCVGGPFESAPCSADADCGAGGTCTGTATVGVGFPQDLRNCTKCHTQGMTASNYKELPSALACTGCHDDVNPSEVTLNGLDPGTNHLPGPQPDAFCRLCHKDQMDSEFDITIPGAHTIPNRSTTLAGLTADIVMASGTASNPVQVQFRLRNGDGTALISFTGLNRIGFAISGPTKDYGGSSTPVIMPTAFGGGATGTLTGPDGTGLATYTTATNLPADATGTWAVGLEARRTVVVNGSNVNEAAIPNPVADFSVDGSPMTARRTIVADANCQNCHGTFSKDFSVHGGLRNTVAYCPLCHNPNVTDFGRRKSAVAFGADPSDQPIALKHLIHKIHRGENLTNQPYIVDGFGSAPKNYAANDFGDVRFPGDLRDCGTCHTGNSQLLPLAPGLLPTVVSAVNAGAEVVSGHTPPIQDACLACHDADAVAAHAETNTTGSGAEACAVCHGEGAIEAVSAVHAIP